MGPRSVAFNTAMGIVEKLMPCRWIVQIEPVEMARAIIERGGADRARDAFTFLRAVASEGAALLGDIQATPAPTAHPPSITEARCFRCRRLITAEEAAEYDGERWAHQERCDLKPPDAPVERGRVCAARHARAIAVANGGAVDDLAVPCHDGTGCGAKVGEACR